ncbi:hypothetical protein MP228_010179 [Amoeboaphelidium protococcarum]|nr:hypothetical protein MP228_010179 [Amoeboaphelidium protococcarum]
MNSKDKKISRIDRCLPRNCCCCISLRTGILTVIVLNSIVQIVLLASFYKYQFTLGGLVWMALISAVSLAIYILGFIGIIKQKRFLLRIFTYWYSIIELGLTIANIVLLPAFLNMGEAVDACSKQLNQTAIVRTPDEINSICVTATNTSIAFGILIPTIWKFYISAVVWSYWKQIKNNRTDTEGIPLGASAI